MAIQVKGYKRRTKKGVTIVNPFSRKGDKKQSNTLLKKAVLGTVGAGVLLGGAAILKSKGISLPFKRKPTVSVREALVNAPNKVKEVPDPWLDNTVTKKVVSAPVASKVSTSSPQKLLPPAKVDIPSVPATPTKVEASGLVLEGKQLNGVNRGHGKLRVVHKGKTAWDKKLVTDNNVLELAQSKGTGSISDNQRALGLIKQQQSQRQLYRRTLRKAKKVSSNIEKTVGVGSKKKVTVNVKKNLDSFVDNFNSTKPKGKTEDLNLETRIAKAAKKVGEIRSKAEAATVKKVKGSRRDLLTLFIPKTLKDAELPDVTSTIQKAESTARRVIKNNSDTISNAGNAVKKQVGVAKDAVEKAKKTVGTNIDNELKKIVPKNEAAQNLTKAAKKEAKKNTEIQALNKVNPLLGKIHYVKEDIKSRAEQLTRYSDELENSGNDVLGRRQLFKETTQKVVKEVTKKPKDGLYAAKGTIGKTRVTVRTARNTPNSIVQNISSMEQQGGKFYGKKGDLGVYVSRTKPAYRPSRGLLRRLSQSNERFMRWKSGNLD